MSVSLLEVIEHGGYDLSTYEDALWLICQEREFEELLEQAHAIVDAAAELELEENEREVERELEESEREYADWLERTA